MPLCCELDLASKERRGGYLDSLGVLLWYWQRIHVLHLAWSLFPHDHFEQNYVFSLHPGANVALRQASTWFLALYWVLPE